MVLTVTEKDSRRKLRVRGESKFEDFTLSVQFNTISTPPSPLSPPLFFYKKHDKRLGLNWPKLEGSVWVDL